MVNFIRAKFSNGCSTCFIIRLRANHGYVWIFILSILSFWDDLHIEDVLRARLGTIGVEEHRLVMETGLCDP